jgi:hypothetical protein
MRACLLPVLLMLVATSGAAAQKSCIEQLDFPPVGGWAEYSAVLQNKDPYTMRYAVIGDESRAGKPLKWLELRMTSSKKDGNMIYQMLVPGSPSQLADVHEIVMKHGEKPAMKMDGMMLKMMRGQLEKQSFLTDICKDVTLVGPAEVSVPAGKFKGQQFHSAKYESDTWITAGVPFSMVKSVGKDYRLELVGHGKGAKSSITETPHNMGAR